MTIFPTPHWHELDGGRYIGTADCVITAEPEEGGWANVGIYRVQLHDKNTLGLYISPGHHARIMREKYWDKGKSCPVVVTFGQDPLLFLVAGQSLPYGMSELDYYGGLRGAPVDVVRGDVSGLPIPATAEIAIEGEVPPPKEQVQMGGPFGECPGYHGRAQLAGIAALRSRAGNYHGRFVIVVDDDVDPSDMKEVIWAVSTRCDPKTAISIIDGCWSTPLDPAMHPDQRDAGNFVNSRAILNACRPYAWKDRFPPVNALSPDLRKKISEKWEKELE